MFSVIRASSLQTYETSYWIGDTRILATGQL
jgi:hypothetical protein